MELRIYRATEAFLYLPTYIAQDLQIFDTLLKNNEFGIKSVEFITSNGDVDAIKDMLEANKEEGVIAIAIGDPIAFLSNTSSIDENDWKNIKVIGAIINRLTYWAVDHKKKHLINCLNLRMSLIK